MTQPDNAPSDAAEDRRQALIKVGRFIAVTAPVVTLLLAAGAKSAKATVLSPFIL
jgi:hypothetical protein